MTEHSSAVLVTGATGTVGSGVVAHLMQHGVRVRALTRSPEQVSLGEGAVTVPGQLSDPDAMAAALEGVDGLFLLSPVAADELTGTLLTLDLARRAGIRAVVYLSVIHADRFTEPSHFAAKAAAERMIEQYRMPATMLRPGYYMQNDLAERDRIVGDGVYGPPVGRVGVLATDVRDLAEVGAEALLERLADPGPRAPETLDVAAPDTLTGDRIAAVWSEVLGRSVVYGGDDLDGLEGFMRTIAPAWMARDMRLMMDRFERDGMTAAPGTDDRLRALLGRPMRSYADFATETAAGWAPAPA